MWKIVPLTILECLLLTGGQVLLKLALGRMLPFGWNRAFLSSVFVNWQFAACGVCFALASLLWMYIVRMFPFSVAYPMVSLSYVLGMVAAVVVFREQVPPLRWLGVLLIVAGCLLVARPSAAQPAQRETAVLSQIAASACQVQSLRCDFVQTKQQRLLSGKSVSRGRLCYRQPDCLRWEYVSPSPHVIVSGGKGGSRVSRQIARLMLEALSGKSLSDGKTFTASLAVTDREWVVTLEPKRRELRQMLSRIVLHFPVGKGVASRVELLEAAGDLTVIDLSNVETGIPLDDSLFDEKPKK